MEKSRTKYLMISMMIIAIFVLVVSIASLYTEKMITCGRAQACLIPISFLIPIVGSIGLFIGTLVYYLMSGKIERKTINLEDCSKIVEKLLSDEERKVLKILASYDKISQARIAKMIGLSRLKVFRIVERLKEKGILEKENEGKARIVRLNPAVRNFLRTLA